MWRCTAHRLWAKLKNVERIYYIHQRTAGIGKVIGPLMISKKHNSAVVPLLADPIISVMVMGYSQKKDLDQKKDPRSCTPQPTRESYSEFF